MNIKRTAAGIAALCLVSAVSFTTGLGASPKFTNAASKFGDINGDGKIDAKDASVILSYYSYLSTQSGSTMSLSDFMAYGPDYDPSHGGSGNVSLETGGDTFTIAAWNASEVPYLIAQWKGLDYESTFDDLRFVYFGVGGGSAPEKYDQYFNSGRDLDVYFCEPYWGLKYINDDSRTAPLSAIGITDADTANMYPYTLEYGKDSTGVLKGLSWDPSPGGFGYRTDLAKQYLGVSSPEEMQAAIGDWDSFASAAKTVASKTGGRVALADSVGGMWQAYSFGRTQPYVVNNKINLGSDVKEFADIAKTLWNCGGVTKNGQWYEEWTAAGESGNCMGYFVPTWGFGGFFLDAAGGKNGATYGKWAVCQGPQPYYWGGTMALVNPSTDNGEEARDFILSACINNDQMRSYAVCRPEFVNNMAVMDKLIAEGTVFNNTISQNLGGQNYLSELNKNAKAINNKGLITPYDETIRTQIINHIVDDYIKSGYSWEKTQTNIRNGIYEYCPYLD